MTTAVIDYGVGNLLSVRRALEHCGASVVVTSDTRIIASAGHVVLPGVGAFGPAMAELKARDLDRVILDVAVRGVPLLGICLGMQLLMEFSEEFGTWPGLGLIAGGVKRICPATPQSDQRKIPHIGWSPLCRSVDCGSWSETPLERISESDEFYFVHSYMACPERPSHRLAFSSYDDQQVTAVIGNGSVFGVQFHPEKSGLVGLKLLSTFLRSVGRRGSPSSFVVNL